MNKVWIIAAVAFIVIGLILFTVVMSSYHWDFSKLSTVKYETVTHEISEAFHSISIQTDTAHLSFAVSDGEECRVDAYENEKVRYSVSVKEGVLIVTEEDERKWYEHIGISFESPAITVHLPKEEYESLFIKEHTGSIVIPKDFRFGEVEIAATTGNVWFASASSGTVQIKTSTGNILVENTSAESLDLSVSTGGVTVTDADCTGDIRIHVSTGKTVLTDVACRNLTSDGDTGDITLRSVIAEEAFSIKRSTGDVRFDSSDAGEIVVVTDTGDVRGNLLSDKVFITRTDTGKVDVPKTTIGGKCEITTDTGDIRISVN